MTADGPVLPDGWDYRQVSDVLSLRNGYPFKPTDWATSGRPIIRIQNLKSDAAAYNYYQGELPDRFKAQPGDLLFAWSGTPGTSFGAHIWGGPEAWVNQHIFRVDFSDDDFDRDFLKLALNYNLADYIAQAQGGVGLAHITKAKLDHSFLVHPPVPVQKAIAALIARHEDLHNKASDHLAVAGRSIELFRRSVLMSACSGGLTQEWRENHQVTRPAVPPGNTRRSAKLLGIGEYELSPLPDEWAWVQLNDLLPVNGIFDGPFGSNLKTSDYTESGARVVRLENIGHLNFIGSKQSFVSPEKYRSLLKHAVQPGDVVFSSFVDEDIRVCVLPDSLDEQALAKADCFTLRPNDIITPKYLAMQLASARSYGFLVSHVHGATRPRVNTTQLKSLPIPLCSIAEQREIVRSYESLVKVADEHAAKAALAKRCIDLTSAAILAKAFRR